MRVPEAWRLEEVWDREVRDGGKGNFVVKERSQHNALLMAGTKTVPIGVVECESSLFVYSIMDSPHIDSYHY